MPVGLKGPSYTGGTEVVHQETKRVKVLAKFLLNYPLLIVSGSPYEFHCEFYMSL
ncbi:hypothetical protein JCM17380_54600 [Desulfosporosinus burensis]